MIRLSEKVQPIAELPSYFPRSGSVHTVDTSIHAWEGPVDDSGMRAVVNSVIARMRSRGWEVALDASVSKVIRHGYWIGRKGDLEVKLERCGRHLSVNFFQNINFENGRGGEYDFARFAKLPRQMRLACVAEMVALLRKLEELGYTLDAKRGLSEPLASNLLRVLEGRLHEDDALARFNDGWGADRFERDETGWPSAKETRIWAQKDADRVPIKNGDWRYARDSGGRLVHGQMFGGINGNWSLVSNGTTVVYHVGESFSEPERLPRRLVPRQYERLRAELAKATAAESWARVAVLGAVLARLAKMAAAK